MPRKRYTCPDQIELFPLEQTLRLFIGLLPDVATQSAIGRQSLAWQLPPSVLRTRAERLHMTMCFLGDVVVSRAIELQEALAEVPMEDMQLRLRTPALWGVAVVQPDENRRLRALHERLWRPLQRVGLRTTGATAWTPHVTIARRTEGAVPPAHLPVVDWTARDFALVWSRFSPVTAYEVLRRYGAPQGQGSTGASPGTNLAPCP